MFVVWAIIIHFFLWIKFWHFSNIKINQIKCLTSACVPLFFCSFDAWCRSKFPHFLGNLLIQNWKQKNFCLWNRFSEKSLQNLIGIFWFSAFRWWLNRKLCVFNVQYAVLSFAKSNHLKQFHLYYRKNDFSLFPLLPIYKFLL